MPFTEFEINKPIRLKELLRKLYELSNEYHAELYLVDEFWDDLGVLRNTIQKEISKS